MKLFMKKAFFLFVVSCFITQLSIIAQSEGFPPWDDFQKMLESRIIKVTVKRDGDFCILDEKKEWDDLIFELLQDGVEAKKRGQIKKASLIADCCYALSDCRDLVFTVLDGQYPSDWIEEFDMTQYSPKQLEKFKYEWDDFLKMMDVEVECSLLVQYVVGRALAHCWQLREVLESYSEPKERVVNKEQNQPMRHIVSTTEPVSHYFATVAVCAAAGAGIIWLMNRETKAL